MAEKATVTVEAGATSYTVTAEVQANRDLRLVCADERGAVADVVLCLDQGADPVKSATPTPAGQQS